MTTTSSNDEMITAAAVVSEREFLQWLNTSQPGDRLTYHLGNLAFDRDHDIKIDVVGTAAWGAHQADKVTLTQRRVEEKVCAYVATRKF